MPTFFLNKKRLENKKRKKTLKTFFTSMPSGTSAQQQMRAVPR